MPGWLDPSATRVRLKEAQEEEARAAFAAEVKRLQAQQDRLCEMLAEINYEFAWRKFLRKYSPSQPRVPAGNPDGGQWTSEEGGSGGWMLNSIPSPATKPTHEPSGRSLISEIPTACASSSCAIEASQRVIASTRPFQ